MEIERSHAEITATDLHDLYEGSKARLKEYFIEGGGRKWLTLYNIEKPLAVALCQGAGMHYYDKVNGVKDFDIWFFYPFNEKHLPYRTIWNWDYKNSKFGRHPKTIGYEGRVVDVLVRSVRHYSESHPAKTIHQFLTVEGTASSRELAKKAAVMLFPESCFGKVVWYKGKV